jgi:SAM-dependent methyltransferase
MSLRFHEIAETDHRIQNPFSAAKLRSLGEICEVTSDTELLDLACGKGELLCQWAARHGATGTGVDVSEVFVEAARGRSTELDVADRVSFERADATEYPVETHDVDVATCIGATWIGGGLVGTLDMLHRAASDDSLLVVGEAFWNEAPTPEAVEAVADGDEEGFELLPDLIDRAQEAGYELVETIRSNGDDWDRYEAKRWKAVDEYLREHPDDPDRDALYQWIDDNRSTYLRYGRTYLGWGALVFRVGSPIGSH